MPVTTFDIPEGLLSFIDELIKSGNARNRREVVVRALETFVRLQAQNWNGSTIIINGVRKGLISKVSIAELVSGMSEEELYKAGRRMGKTLRDMALGKRVDISRRENHRTALQMLENLGWGKFSIDADRITIMEPFLPRAVIHGYLETALSTTLSRIDTTEDIIVFQKETVSSVAEQPLVR